MCGPGEVFISNLHRMYRRLYRGLLFLAVGGGHVLPSRRCAWNVRTLLWNAAAYSSGSGWCMSTSAQTAEVRLSDDEGVDKYPWSSACAVDVGAGKRYFASSVGRRTEHSTSNRRCSALTRRKPRSPTSPSNHDLADQDCTPRQPRLHQCLRRRSGKTLRQWHIDELFVLTDLRVWCIGQSFYAGASLTSAQPLRRVIWPTCTGENCRWFRRI